MKQIIYRLFKTPLFWVLSIVTVGFVLILSERYYNTANGPAFYWDCYIESYSSQEELKEQKKSVENHLIWLQEEAITFADEENYKDELALTIKTIDVMEYLLENELPYGGVVEGTFYGAGSNDRRAYNGYISENCTIFMLFASVILLLLVVTLSRSNGTYVNDVLKYGRTRLMINEAVSFFSLQILFFLCQFASAWFIRFQFDSIGKQYLYYYGGECHVFSPDMVQLAEWADRFVFLLLCWTLFFVLAELLNHSIVFLILGFVLAYYLRGDIMHTSEEIYERWFSTWPSYRVYGFGDVWYILKYIIWLAIGALFSFITWLFIRRRNCKLKCE
ncbi:MAG: hypothetical protein IKS10_04880 [Lachnospiraceae bacterium]|nr:hypothetical protein [Lachnospiraceae bacterium]